MILFCRKLHRLIAIAKSGIFSRPRSSARGYQLKPLLCVRNFDVIHHSSSCTSCILIIVKKCASLPLVQMPTLHLHIPNIIIIVEPLSHIRYWGQRKFWENRTCRNLLQVQRELIDFSIPQYRAY